MTTDLRYERWFLPFSVPFGLGPKQSEVRVSEGALHVRFGWGFRAEIPLTSIKEAKPTPTGCTRGAPTAFAADGW